MSDLQSTQAYKPVQYYPFGADGIMGKPIGYPAPQFHAQPIITPGKPPPIDIPGANLPRSVNYYADYAGCGWWRMIAPELLLNMYNKSIITGLTTMVLDPRFYNGISSVRLQRQATPVQLQFLRFLEHGSKEHNYKIIYEIDDIIVKDDIPDYNRCKVAFESEEILNSCMEMMTMSDEITVTCQYMKEYYASKTGNKNITVLPNYPARMWMDGHYNKAKIQKDFQQNKKKPRIAYVGSGTHIDVLNKTNQRDDFSHIVDSIIKSRKDFQWVFVGCFPLACKPFIDRGEMEFVQWFDLMELAKAYTTTNINAVIAPLENNIFNNAKSNIKYLEASTCGIPGIFQDLITYKDAPLRFNSGSDMIDQIKKLTKNTDTYMKYSAKARKYADTMWLDDHLNEFAEVYNTRIGDPKREALLRLNPDQKI